MATRQEIVAAIKARIATVIPAPGADRSDRTEGVNRRALPAYAVRAVLLSAERASMGSTEYRMIDRVEVAILTSQGEGLGNAAEALAGQIRDAILADPPDLGGLVYDLRLAGQAYEIEAGEVRVARAEIGFDAEHFGALG